MYPSFENSSTGIAILLSRPVRILVQHLEVIPTLGKYVVNTQEANNHTGCKIGLYWNTEYIILFVLQLSRCKTEPLFWFWSDTETQIKNGRNFWASLNHKCKERNLITDNQVYCKIFLNYYSRASLVSYPT